MAARDQRNRNNRRMKKKGTQKKQNQVRRKQPKKQKKRPARKVGSRIFAAKILRHMPKVRMETKARRLMKRLLMDVYDHMSKEVENLNQNSEQPIVNPSNIQTVLKEAMARELAKHKRILERMETKARELMNTLQMDVNDRMSNEVESRNQNNEPSNMQAALKGAMANELAKHMAESTSNETTAAA